MILQREPAAILGAAHAIGALILGFGANITLTQFGLIEAALASVLALVVRSKVTPVDGADDAGAVTLMEACLLLAVVILVLWAFGEVPR